MMLRKVLVFLGLLALLLTIFATGGSALAATSSGPSTSSNIDVATLQKTCSIIHIHLDGLNHIITCTRHRQKGIQPNLYRDDSCNPNNYTLVVYNYGYSGVLCFDGSGYLGVGIYDVNEVDDTGYLGAWFLYYPAHRYWSLLGGGYAVIGTGNRSGTTVTQLCYGNANPPNC